MPLDEPGDEPGQAGRPRQFPTAVSWLVAGMGSNGWGVLGALLGTWFYLPFALLVSAVAAVVLGVVGFFGGFLAGSGRVPAWLAELPVLGAAAEAFLPASGSVLGGLLGVLLGLVLGFVGALLLFWAVVFADDPVAGVGWVIGVAATGLCVGALYTLYRVGLEPVLLRASGARRMSRRERELVLPIARSCARALGLANHPPILMDDRPDAYPTAHARHIVLSRSLLAELDQDPGAVAGVLSHELVHWRDGDAISAAFLRGVALPLYLIYAAVSWVTQLVRSTRGGFGWAGLLLWLFFWPVMVTVRYFVVPLQGAGVRRAELRADQGAVRAGHRAGLQRVLARDPGRFEGGRNGWTRAVCATHPPAELRLEQLEESPEGGEPPEGGERGGDRAAPGRPRAWPRRAVLAGAAGAVLLVAVVYAVRATVAAPESTVYAYFDALAGRDAAAALATFSPEIAERTNLDVINDTVLGSADYLPPEAVEVTGVTVDDREAVAEVRYTLDGRQYAHPVRLRRGGGFTDSVVHSWRIIDRIGAIQLPGEAPAEITVNGQRVTAFDPQGPRILPALVGVYRIGIPGDDPVWEPRAVPVRVGPLETSRVDLGLTVRPAVRAAVKEQVAALLAACENSAELVPPDCPFRYRRDVAATDVRWRIVSEPRLVLRPGPGSNGSAAGEPVVSVESSRDGQARVTGTRDLGSTFFQVDDTVAFQITGVAVVSGSTVLFQPGW